MGRSKDKDVKDKTECKPYLDILGKCTPRMRKAILREAPNGLVQLISNCCSQGLYNKDIQFTTEQKKCLKRNKKLIASLASKKHSLKTKKTLLQQGAGGDFLKTLLPAVLKTVGHVLVL